MRMSKISSSSFYNEFYGHKIEHLDALLPMLRESSDAIIWTAGDSSLDNKYWFRDRRPSVGAYQDILDPPISVCDVTYWLNAISQQQDGPRLVAINGAVEATTLNERSFTLRPQDIFIRDNLARNDILVVSIGGNDIAMAPTPCTICSMIGLLSLPIACLEHACSCATCPVDDACWGCGPSLLSCACAFPPCTGYFRHMFGVRTQKYIQALTRKTKPKMILVCMIYYPDEAIIPSWAGMALEALRYNSFPAKLQLMIRKTFELATSRIDIAGTDVIPVPLFTVLDGKQSEDFVARVEPSAIGGGKMARFILDIIRRQSSNYDSTNMRANYISAPTTAYIQDRS